MNAAQPGALIAMKNMSGLCISRTATRLTRLGKMAKTLADMTAEERADSQIARLQAAVREMMESLNALEYSHYNTRNNLEAYKPSTIETYGLMQEDME